MHKNILILLNQIVQFKKGNILFHVIVIGIECLQIDIEEKYQHHL